MNYHYEFNDILKLDKIWYNITIPIIKNAKWINDIGYFLLENTTIQVFYNDNLLDKKIITPHYRIIYDEIYCQKDTTNKTYFKLYPYNLLKDYSYLLYGNVPAYKVVCDVKININPKLEDMCICLDKNLISKIEIEGNFKVDEIIEKEIIEKEIIKNEIIENEIIENKIIENEIIKIEI